MPAYGWRKRAPRRAAPTVGPDGAPLPPTWPTRTTLPTEAEFWSWAETVPIASRDAGLTTITPWGTQRREVHEILTGLQEGYHQFLVRKAGQVGSTEVCKLIALYWHTHFPGLQGSFIADSDDLREYCRDTLVEMGKAAPDPVDMRMNNAQTLAWVNGSKMIWQTAGPRSGRRLNVGRGVAFCIGTEAPLWQDPKAITYLRTRFSNVHPQRLFIFEGTSRGRNWWYDICQEAEDAADIKLIELLWWMREDYVVDPTSEIYKLYWDGHLTTREKRWARELKKRYRTELTPGQWAWRRHYVSEKAGGDERVADQEMPTLIEDSFEATGISFLDDLALRHAKRSVTQAGAGKRYRYVVGATIEETSLQPTIPGYGTLQVWEEPITAEAYVVAAVPAHSTEPKCELYAATVWRAWIDRLEQVVAFADQECGMQPFSWVLAHLCGTYGVVRRAFILETAGLGNGVLTELDRLQQSGWGTMHRTALNNVVGGIKHYLWRRPDSLGAGLARQWRSSIDNEGWALQRLRDQISAGRVLLRDKAALNELERVRRVGDTFQSESSEPGFHRVFSAALAVEAWAKYLVPRFKRIQGTTGAKTVPERLVKDFFDRINRQAVTGGGRR